MEGLSSLSKMEIVSLFFLTTEFLSFRIQDNNKQDFLRENRSRVILACWLAGLSCKPTPFKSKRKVLIGTLTLEVRKMFYLKSYPQCAD